MVIWIVGLAGAGKTTLAREVVARLRAAGRSVVLLDGDEVRSVMGDDLGHLPAERDENGRRIARLCGLLDRQGLDVVAAVMSNDPGQQQANRATFSAYRQVFLDVPLEALEARDQKGLYSGARRGEVHDVVGMDIEYRRPVESDVVFAGPDALAPPEQLAERVLAAAEAVR